MIIPKPLTAREQEFADILTNLPKVLKNRSRFGGGMGIVIKDDGECRCLIRRLHGEGEIYINMEKTRVKVCSVCNYIAGFTVEPLILTSKSS